MYCNVLTYLKSCRNKRSKTVQDRACESFGFEISQSLFLVFFFNYSILVRNIDRIQISSLSYYYCYIFHNICNFFKSYHEINQRNYAIDYKQRSSYNTTMSQISHFNLIRPATSCGFRNKNVINQELVESDELKKFRSSFPNLPGFSKHSSFRPQSPKVS